ncbi:SAST synthase, partial [Baryphthengus martii]|nr:SAST synthase [Baryphthengus martii]
FFVGFFFFSVMEDLIVCLCKRPEAVYRLICFSWAGGGTAHLAGWGKLFNSSIEVSSIRLPKRASHHKEPLAKDMKTIADEITSVLLEYFQEKPFAIFGHSFGSYVGFSVALCLKEKYGLEPIHLFVSAAHAPHSEAFLLVKNMALSDIEDEDLVTYMQMLGSPELLQNKYIKKHAIRTFREDYKLLETLSFEKTENNTPFSCSITCFTGSEDKECDFKAWQDLTSGDASFYSLPGGHFYLLQPSNEMFLTKYITRYIENTDI